MVWSVGCSILSSSASHRHKFSIAFIYGNHVMCSIIGVYWWPLPKCSIAYIFILLCLVAIATAIMDDDKMQTVRCHALQFLFHQFQNSWKKILLSDQSIAKLLIYGSNRLSACVIDSGDRRCDAPEASSKRRINRSKYPRDHSSQHAFCTAERRRAFHLYKIRLWGSRSSPSSKGCNVQSRNRAVCCHLY